MCRRNGPHLPAAYLFSDWIFPLKYAPFSALLLGLAACQFLTADAEPDAPVFDLSPEMKQIIDIAHDPADPYVLIEAHRGCHSLERPENTLLALEHCVAIGADWIELDIALTSDNQLVLMHDRTLDRTTTLSGRVDEYTLAEITSAYIKDDNGEVTSLHPPTFDEALDLMADRVLFRLDIKCYARCEKSGYDIVGAVYDMVIAKGILDQSVVEPDVRKLMIANGLSDDQFVVVGPKIEDIGTPENIPPHADYIQVKDFDPDAPPIELMKQFAPVIRMVGFPYSENRSGGHGDTTSETDPDAGWGWLVEHGADMLLTNNAEGVITYLEANGYREK